MYDDLPSWRAERAALDGSSRRTVVAAGMTNQLINLLERGGPNPDETELINQIGGMVQQSSVQVAETSSRLFSNWMQEQQELRRMQGVNLAMLFDTGTPAPDFTAQALASAGLGPAGTGTYASLAFAATGTAGWRAWATWLTACA